MAKIGSEGGREDINPQEVDIEAYKTAIADYISAMGAYIEEAEKFKQNPSKPPKNYVAAKKNILKLSQLTQAL